MHMINIDLESLKVLGHGATLFLHIIYIISPILLLLITLILIRSIIKDEVYNIKKRNNKNKTISKQNNKINNSSNKLSRSKTNNKVHYKKIFNNEQCMYDILYDIDINNIDKSRFKKLDITFDKNGHAIK